MEAFVLIGFLLVFTVAGHPAVEGIEKDELYDNYKATNNDISQDVPSTEEQFYGYIDGEVVDLDLKGEPYEPEEEVDIDLALDMESRVLYYLYTRSNRTHFEQLFVNNEEALSKSKFDPSKPMKIITHGFLNSYKSGACVQIRNAYMNHGDYNILVIDWSRITMRPYFWSRSQVKSVAKHVASMVNFLIAHGMNPSQTTMVGHSLGAHVVGLAAREANGKINYLVGLDPALPKFRLFSSRDIIQKTDAEHVEIIHTNAGFLGFNRDLGHIDFYPNGGSSQPGCYSWGLLTIVCSHARSYELFAESINTPVGFIGKACETYEEFTKGLCNTQTWEIMGGYKVKILHRGKFFLDTNPQYPYAVGM